MNHCKTLAGTLIWIVDSDEGSRLTTAEQLKSSGAQTSQFGGFVECDERIDTLDQGSIPDLAIIGLLLHDGIGADIVRRLSNPAIFCPCLVTTVPSHSTRHVFKALTCGAYLVIAKPFPVFEICDPAIQWGRERRASISRSLQASFNPRTRNERGLSALNVLTKNEIAVARLYGDGETRDAIARARGVSVNTVKTQISSIYAKLEVNSRASLRALLRQPHTGDSTSECRTRRYLPNTPYMSTRYSRMGKSR